MSFFTELKRRQVVKIAAAYLVVAWLLIQITDTIAPALHLPDWTLSLVVWIAIIGFVPAVLFAWIFQITPDGLRRDAGEGETPSDPGVSRRVNVALSVLLVGAVGYIAVDYFRGNAEPGLADTSSAADGAYDSIAVLPFANLSSDPEQEYLSDGLAEELLNLLAQLGELKVAARTSSFSFKGQNIDIRDIGTALEVDTVLEGSVRKSGNRIRVTAQLIDAANGYHLWSDTYDRDLTDIFAIQDEVSASIVGALKVHLAGAAPMAAVVDIEAYDRYLRALDLERNSEFEEALKLYREVTELDESFAAAWAARARLVLALRETDYWGDIPREEALALARANIDRALAINPQSAEALTAQGRLLWEEYRYEEALASIAQALEANPNLAKTHAEQATLLIARGDVNAAWSALERAMSLDPLDRVHLIRAFNAFTSFPKPRFEKALLERLSRLDVEGFWLNEQVVAAARRSFYLEDPVGQLREAVQMLRSNGLGLEALPPQLAFVVAEGFAEMHTSRLATFKYPEEIAMEFALFEGDFERALEMHNALPDERRETDVSLERLSLIELGRGDCVASLAALDEAHDGELRIYTQVAPDYERSNPNLAANRAWCLRSLGDDAAAEEVLDAARGYYDRVQRDFGSFPRLEAKLLTAAGDFDGALAALERGFEACTLGWIELNDGVLVQQYAGDPRYEALKQRVWDRVNGWRAEAGWPPTDKKLAWDSGEPFPEESFTDE